MNYLMFIQRFQFCGVWQMSEIVTADNPSPGKYKIKLRKQACCVQFAS